jgi:phosphotransacetylase
MLTAADQATELTRRWSAALAGMCPRVVLADGDDPRAVEAAEVLAATTPVVPVLVSDTAVPGRGVEVLPVERGRGVPEVAACLDAVLERRRGATARERAALAADPLYVATAAVRSGHAHAAVGGASRPTADVIRAGLRVLGLGVGVTTVSSCFLLAFPDGRLYAYGDCAVVPEPDAEQLADIAVSTGRTFTELSGRRPVVAMLSFSTKGSAEHPGVQRVRTAARLAQARSPGLALDGELQFDAAIAETVAGRKAPDSAVAGRANVLIFPNLDAGNIAYKLSERLAGAAAVGPILQGLAAPLNDLSRGCEVSDIVRVAMASAVQAVHRAPLRRCRPPG